MQACAKDGRLSNLKLINTEQRSSEWTGYLNERKERTGLPQTPSRVVCKPTNAAISGNTICGERLVKTRTKILVGKYCLNELANSTDNEAVVTE